jgi:hypothetical protein
METEITLETREREHILWVEYEIDGGFYESSLSGPEETPEVCILDTYIGSRSVLKVLTSDEIANIEEKIYNQHFN